jgi:hypothetical protein
MPLPHGVDVMLPALNDVPDNLSTAGLLDMRQYGACGRAAVYPGVGCLMAAIRVRGSSVLVPITIAAASAALVGLAMTRGTGQHSPAPSGRRPSAPFDGVEISRGGV